MSGADASPEPLVSFVVAAARNGTIGRDGEMPWRLARDLKRFKQVTLGKAMVMGRRTFDSIGRSLPGRHTIVVTRDASWSAWGAERASDPDDGLRRAFEWTRAKGGREVCVAGGGEIYRALRDRAAMLRLTRVEADIEGDTLFDLPDPARWREVSAVTVPAGPRDTHPTRYSLLLRRTS